MISRIALISTLAVAGSAFGQDVPDRNPEQNADGTKTYWTGNNMQWDTQEAIDDCNPGDIIVIRGGDYVNSLSVDKPNITIRPFVNEDGEWEEVNLWNPTQGPEQQNGWAIYVGPNTENTYIGHPRQFRQLASGFVSENTIVPGEYGNPGGSPMEVDSISGDCFTFWSRSVDNTGVMSVDGKATIENCIFTSQNGFGGGAMLVGSANDTAFVDCTFENLYANGTTLRTDVPGLAMANYCISIHTEAGGIMEYTFADCKIKDNRGEAIVWQDGGRGAWTDCKFEDNDAQTNFGGVIDLMSCNPSFNDCEFRRNDSGYGTIFMNGSGVSSLDGARFFECKFENNTTIDGQWGGVFYAVDDKGAYGGAPKVIFDDCDMDGNNGNSDVNQDDWVSPWFPTYRQGDSNEDAITAESGDGSGGVCTPSADLNNDGIVDGQDLGVMFGLWGTNGTL